MGDPNKRLPHYLERRSHARRTVIESRLISVELGKSARGVLIDVSEGGLAVQPFVPLPVGAKSDLYFEMPTGTPVKAHGMVAWVGENGRTGIRFTEVQPEALVDIRRWITEEVDTTRASAEVTAAPPDFSALPSLSTVTEGGESVATTPRTSDLLQLDAAVQRAQLLTRADGAAIALREGDEIRCVSMVGEAPDVGVTVTPGVGIAGECLLSGQPVLCCDARTDRRVNREAALALDMSSCAIVPILNAGQPDGLIAVFSTRPDAFDEEHLAALSRLASELRATSPK